MPIPEKVSIAAAASLGCAVTALAFLSPSMPRAQRSAAFDWHSAEEKVSETGSTRSFLNAQTDMLDKLECHATTLKPGLSPHPPHSHPEEELYVIKEGTVEVFVNGERKRLGPGSLVFAAAGQPHGISNIGQAPATYHVIKWLARPKEEQPSS